MQALRGRLSRLIFILSFFLLLTTFYSNFNLKIVIFNIKEINILGTEYLEQDIKNDIYTELLNKDLFFINRKNLNLLLSKSEWVDQYHLKKTYPHQIDITIKEFKPLALQTSNNNFYIINSDFRKIKINDNKQHKFLSIIGNPDLNEIKNLLSSLSKKNLLSDFSAAEYKESQRWDLILKNQSRVLLARNNLQDQFEILKNILNKIKNFTTIDLRFNQRFIVKKHD